MIRKLIFLLISIAVISTVGCKQATIPNTEIEDNNYNREIIEFCERYRHAIEDLNIGLLLSIASPRYFDNAGTIVTTDDFDRTGLEDVLTTRFQPLQAMRYEIKYRRIFEQNGIVFIEYTYTTSFQYTVGDKTKWHNKTADNRLEIERVDDGFLIVSGM